MYTEYSPNEKKMIEYYGFTDVAERMFPSTLYPLMAAKAFIMNDNSVYSDALRKAIKHMEHNYRMTPEFEALISVEI